MQTQLIPFMKQYLLGGLHKPEGALRHPFITPSSVYSASLWDWDCYWAMLAYLEISRQTNDEELKQLIAPYAKGCLFNYLDHQYPDGCISIGFGAKGNDYFMCYNPDHNMAKPIMGQIAHLLWQHGLLSQDELRQVIPCLQKFHRCYVSRYSHFATGLLYFATDLGIGVDDDPSTWGRPFKSSASIYLNSFFYRDTALTAELCRAASLDDTESRETSERMAKSIRTYCYDKREKSFFTVDLLCQHNLVQAEDGGVFNVGLTPFWKVLPLKVLTWSTMLPLWMGLGTQQQVDDYIKEHFVPEQLLSPYGIRSLSADEPMYAPEVKRGNPSNWLGPIWMVENYVAWDMMRKYGHQAEAEDLAQRVLNLVNRDIAETGTLHEYYSPETGKPINNAGLLSWNPLVTLF